MGGIMLNEDCNHFVYSRHKAGVKVGINELHEFIDQYANTNVKEFIMNVNAMLAWFPAKTWENVIDKYIKLKKIGKDPGESGNVVATSYDIFINQGIDMYKIWIDRLREKGISPWLSIRMNDIHNNDDEEHFLHSSFFSRNKHMRRAAYRPNASYYDNALDYTFPEVREHYLSLIYEVTERYDFDGLELDWMREVFCLKIGSEWEGTKILTEFMRKIREILDYAEKQKKHKIKIGVRVPQSPELALRFGIDVVTWAKEKLVDVIVPTARWATTDNDMPIDLWKRILDGTGVMLGAGLEILIEATCTQPKRWMFNSVETARGSAVAYLSMGADRIYLFNYMDLPVAESFDPRMAGSAVDPKYYKELLTTIGELKIAMNLPRRHIVTYHDITAPGVRVGNILPIICHPINSAVKPEFADARIATGPINRDSKVTLIIGANSEDKLEASDFLVYLNGVLCEFEGLVDLPQPKPACRTYSFKVETHNKFPEASIVEIASIKRFFSVEWIEISIGGTL
ncbi:MAG: hypothetical protein HPY74_02955 [Firmicutes bacterium]|nr:hypothetical protein [Bacillota bacterium]